VPSPGDVVGNYAFIDDVVDGHFKALQHSLNGENTSWAVRTFRTPGFFKPSYKPAAAIPRMVSVPKSLMKAWSAVVFGTCYVSGKHTNISPKVMSGFSKTAR
jgi:hypothetical protein